MSTPVENIRITRQQVLISPTEFRGKLPLTEAGKNKVAGHRQAVQNILNGKDHRLFMVVGPCSVHNIDQALEYASHLQKLAEVVQESILIIMRVYFEKPRTTVGWKGLINDPEMNDSFKIEKGLGMARGLLLQLNDMGLPTATEALDPIVPQYINDLITWSAIGARTTESQTHREMASGLSSPVGFKNGTDGGLGIMVNAIRSSLRPHRFLGINDKGAVAVIHTSGNPWVHAVLRGGNQGPNYDSVHITECEDALDKAGVARNIVVDCSHANSNKQYALQPLVMQNIAEQISEGNNSICGLMLESNLEAGNQSIPQDLKQLRYGVSVTDACIDWKTTEKGILELHQKIAKVLPKRKRDAIMQTGDAKSSANTNSFSNTKVA